MAAVISASSDDSKDGLGQATADETPGLVKSAYSVATGTVSQRRRKGSRYKI